MMQRWMFHMMGLVCIIVMCTSCYHTRYIPVESVKTDSVFRAAYIRDSIYVRDSIFVKDRGDTIFVDRWHIIDSNKNRVDTVWRCRDREIHVPFPIERELSWWQGMWITVGKVLLPITFLLLSLIAWLFKKKGG